MGTLQELERQLAEVEKTGVGGPWPSSQGFTVYLWNSKPLHKCFDFSTFILHEGIPQTTLQRKNTLNGTPATSQDAAFIVEVIPESLEAAADVTMALRLQLGRLKVLHLTSQS